MGVALAWLSLAGLLLGAAALKAADRTGSTVALAAYGVPGRIAEPAWAALVGVEAALAAGIAAGIEAAAYAAGCVLAGFLVVQVAALARGGEGAPCGCFGARGRLSRGAARRTALLAVACAALPVLGAGPGLPLVLTAAVAAGVVVLSAGRRTAPRGALEIDGEGPPLGAPSPLAAWFEGSEPALALFTSPGCALCKRVAPAAEALADIAVRRFDEIEEPDAWAAARVPGAPFAVALGPGGVVLAKGTVNDARQLESVVEAARSRGGGKSGGAAARSRGGGESGGAAARSRGGGESGGATERSRGGGESGGATERSRGGGDPVAGGTSRRAFLGRASGAVAGATGAGLVGAVIRPGDADAHHFCGHIYTTDGCPHPTGLPRIDRRGFPLRARDGKRIDDLGRVIDGTGRPLDEDGAPLTDLDGRPLPAAPRTKVCSATARSFGLRVRTDGSWYRCCHGRVRKLVDCCAAHPTRINGDRALKGYCYDNRKVFCVMYFQSTVPC
jgi:Methylamine utilisation protein MauE